MFKFATVVRYFLVISLFALMGSLTVWASSERDSSDDGMSRNCLADEINKFTGDAKTQLINDCAAWRKRKARDTDDDCPTATKDFSKAKGEFDEACGTANASPDEHDGHIACSKAMVRCQYCGLKRGDENPTNVRCDNDNDSDSNRKPSGDDIGNGASRVMQAEKLDKFCPSKLASVDQDKLQKEYDQLRKDVKEGEDKLPALQDAANKVNSERDNKIDGFKDEAKAAYSEYQKALLQARRDRDDKQKELTQQLAQLMGQVTQRQNAIRQLGVERAKTRIAFNQRKNVIEQNCYAQAIQQVQKEQNITYAQMGTNSYNRGTQKDLFQNVGISSRQAWQRKARVYKQNCMVDEATTTSQSEAADNLAVGLKQADDSEESLKSEIVDLKNQQAAIQDSRGCGAPPAPGVVGGESQVCAGLRQAQEDMVQAQGDYRTKMDGISTKINTTIRTAAQEYQSKMQEYQTAQARLNEENTRFGNLKKYMELAAKNGGSDNPKAYVEAQAKFGALRQAADKIVKCAKEAKTECSGSCDKAKRFLAALGMITDDMEQQKQANTDLPGVTSAGTTTPPTTTPDTSRTPSGQPQGSRER